MSVLRLFFLIIITLLTFIIIPSCLPSENSDVELTKENGETIKLPDPSYKGEISLEEAVYQRVSHRSFTNQPLALEEVGQLLWAGQGIGIDGLTGASRTAPSAGATHPMDLLLVAGNIEGLDDGIYHYNYAEHTLSLVAQGSYREEIAEIALNQNFIKDAPAIVVLLATYERTTGRYGDRGVRYTHIEAGHITQNIYLQGEALGLGSVAVGAFDEQALQNLLEIDKEPLMIIPVGQPQE